MVGCLASVMSRMVQLMYTGVRPSHSCRLALQLQQMGPNQRMWYRSDQAASALKPAVPPLPRHSCITACFLKRPASLPVDVQIENRCHRNDEEEGSVAARAQQQAGNDVHHPAGTGTPGSSNFWPCAAGKSCFASVKVQQAAEVALQAQTPQRCGLLLAGLGCSTPSPMRCVGQPPVLHEHKEPVAWPGRWVDGKQEAQLRPLQTMLPTMLCADCTLRYARTHALRQPASMRPQDR